MYIDLDTKVFYKQYDINYRVNGKGETVHKADKFKLNIYFEPVKRGSDITNLSTEIEMQRRALQEMKDNIVIHLMTTPQFKGYTSGSESIIIRKTVS